MSHFLRRLYRQTVRDLAEMAFPRYCVICGDRLTRGNLSVYCFRCLEELPLTRFGGKHDNPLSLRFGTLGPNFKEATASIYYDSESDYRKQVLLFKYFDRPELAVNVGKGMAWEVDGSGFFDTVDALVPIPLTEKRRQWRGYNQSEMLARGISLCTGVPVVTDAIVRKTFRQSQTKLNEEQRRENVKDVFEVARPELIKGKHIVIVDDVITYGFTVINCAVKALAVEGVRVSIMAYAVAKSHMHYTPLPKHIHPWD